MGDNHPSLRDVANAAKVSVGTASNFLNNPEKVSTKTRKLVQDAIDSLGFVKQSSPSRANLDSKIIGLIMPSSGSPFYEEIVQGLEDAVSPHGYQVLVGFSREDSANEERLIKSMTDARFKAVVLNSLELNSQGVEKYVGSGAQYLTFVSEANASAKQCSVIFDQIAGGYLGIQYLHSLGHKRILWIANSHTNPYLDERFIGIENAVSEFGIELLQMHVPSLDYLAGEYIGSKILKMDPIPDAIFCANDATALGLMNNFYKVGFKVPGQISVLGFDNIIYGESAMVPLSTVSQTPYQLGFVRGGQLIDEFHDHNRHIHQKVLIKPQIIERSSTQPR